jgi:uncharacterized membrane protein HdeD (DUF308 family)
MSQGSGVTVERRRTGWDVVLGALSVLAGLIVLGHVAVASVISVLFLGWMLSAAGIVLAIGGIVHWSRPGRWWTLVTGGVLLALGIGFLRNPGAGLLVLTLLAGSLLFVGGIARIAASAQPDAPRGMLIASGSISILLSLMILFQFPVSAVWFLGTVLGVELLIDGITTIAVGRYRVVPPAPPVRPAVA